MSPTDSRMHERLSGFLERPVPQEIDLLPRWWGRNNVEPNMRDFLMRLMLEAGETSSAVRRLMVAVTNVDKSLREGDTVKAADIKAMKGFMSDMARREEAQAKKYTGKIMRTEEADSFQRIWDPERGELQKWGETAASLSGEAQRQNSAGTEGSRKSIRQCSCEQIQ